MLPVIRMQIIETITLCMLYCELLPLAAGAREAAVPSSRHQDADRAEEGPSARAG